MPTEKHKGSGPQSVPLTPGEWFLWAMGLQGYQRPPQEPAEDPRPSPEVDVRTEPPRGGSGVKPPRGQPAVTPSPVETAGPVTVNGNVSPVILPAPPPGMVLVHRAVGEAAISYVGTPDDLRAMGAIPEAVR